MILKAIWRNNQATILDIQGKLKLTLFLYCHYDDFDDPTVDHEQVDSEMIEIVNLGEMFDYRDHANRHDTRDMMASELGEWLHCNHFPGSTYRLGKRRFYHENFM